MRGEWIRYSTAELAWIKDHAQLPRSQAFEAFQQAFNRPDVQFINFTALCKRKGWLTGRNGRFEKGKVPANTGKKMPYNENSARHWFKSGVLPHNTKYLGHERISKQGYVEISISETNPHTGYERRYVQKHRYLWEQINGPVPAGMALKCIDGNRGNSDPENWIAVPRGVLPLLNGRWTDLAYDTAPAELKPVLLAVAKLKYKIKQQSSRSP